MELILWRHAEAEDTRPDIERALTPKGRKQAKKMAAWLKARLPADTRILVSPATRTQQTAKALDLDFSTLEALAPGASAQAILEAAGWPDATDPVLIVGHQPTLSMTAALALDWENQYWSMKKGAVWWLSHRKQGDKKIAVLRGMMSPDLLQEKE